MIINKIIYRDETKLKVLIKNAIVLFNLVYFEGTETKTETETRF